MVDKPNADRLAAEVEAHKARKAALESTKQAPAAPPAPETRSIPCITCQAPFDVDVVKIGPREFFGKLCPDCLAKSSAEAAAERVAGQSAILQHEWAAICPPLYRDTDLDRLALPQKVIVEALQWQSGPGIALVGDTGKGKTRLIFQLLRQLHFAGRKVFAISAKNFERHCSRMFDKDQTSREIIDKCQRIEILFLDDLGKERMTERVESELYALVEERTSNLRPIFWTSNADSMTIGSRISDDRSPPIVRRLKEFTTIIAV